MQRGVLASHEAPAMMLQKTQAFCCGWVIHKILKGHGDFTFRIQKPCSVAISIIHAILFLQ
jgi:hypothetical protein